MQIYHHQRTAQWGIWAITFMDVQPDQTKNYGVILGNVRFPIGTRGPCDLPKKAHYKALVEDWIERGNLPAELECMAPS